MMHITCKLKQMHLDYNDYYSVVGHINIYTDAHFWKLY